MGSPLEHGFGRTTLLGGYWLRASRPSEIRPAPCLRQRYIRIVMARTEKRGADILLSRGHNLLAIFRHSFFMTPNCAKPEEEAGAGQIFEADDLYYSPAEFS